MATVAAPAASDQVRWSLLRKSVVAAAIVVIAILGVTITLIRRTVSAGYADLERRQSEANSGRARDAIARELAEVVKVAIDYANWEDTAAFVAGRDPEYPDREMPASTAGNLDVDLLLLFDVAGHVRLALELDREAIAYREVPSGMLAEVVEAAGLAGPAPERPVQGLTMLAGAPALLASHPITNNTATGPPRGTLVFVRHLDDDVVARIASTIRLDVAVTPVAATAARWPDAPTAALDGGAVEIVAGHGQVSAYAPLVDVRGTTRWVVRTSEPRSIFEKGQTTVAMLGWIVLATAVLVLGAVLMVLRFAMIRVRRLARAAAELGRDGRGRRLDADSSDEIALLARAINRMLADRELAEQRVLAHDRLVVTGTLAAGVAHEINNPLNYVLLNIEHLLDEAVEGRLTLAGDTRAALDEAREGIVRAAAIVRDMKLFSTFDDSPAVPTDVRAVVDSAARMLAAATRGRVTVDMDIACAPALATPAKLGQVLVNLIQNAVQALPDRPEGENHIAVTARDRAGQVAIEVRDNGTGIAPEFLPRIFDPFFTTKPVGLGTGLGLSICHGVVTSLAGTLTVESEVGRGTTFCLALPAAAVVAAPAAARSPGQRPRVLVVDDDDRCRRAVVRQLTPDYDIVESNCGGDALATLARGAVDAALLDVTMPGMSGIELYHEIGRRLPALLPHVGFITAGAVSPAAQRVLRNLTDRTLPKPIDRGALVQLVHRLVDEGIAVPILAT